MKIYAIGDSHTIIFHKSRFIFEHWIGFGENKKAFSFPLTIHRLYNEGLNIQNLPDILGNGHENYIPKEGDTVLLSFGFNDVNKNVGKQRDMGRNVNEIIDTLAQNYLNALLTIQNKYQVRVIPYYIIPPTRRTDLSNRYGTPTERAVWTQQLNSRIAEYCKKHDILSLENILSFLSDKEGFLKSEFVNEDGVHIDSKHIETIENAILNYII